MARVQLRAPFFTSCPRRTRGTRVIPTIAVVMCKSGPRAGGGGGSNPPPLIDLIHILVALLCLPPSA